MASKPHRVKPRPGQESVWDYPRPPKLERTPRRLRIVFAGVTIADTTDGYRVLETSHPPVYYLPRKGLKMAHILPDQGDSYCEWKGRAQYHRLVVGKKTLNRVGWSYPNPTPDFAAIKDYIAFYPDPMDACYVDDELVTPQPGSFYGGWITSDVVGPFKGEAGTWGW